MRHPITYEQSEGEGSDAVVAEWLVKVGDQVSQGQAVVEVDVDKVITEIAAPETGLLVQIDIEVDEPVLPGQVLGYIESEN